MTEVEKMPDFENVSLHYKIYWTAIDSNQLILWRWTGCGCSPPPTSTENGFQFRSKNNNNKKKKLYSVTFFCFMLHCTEKKLVFSLKKKKK